MGKYMKKPKITGEVAVMEAAPQFSLGVRTRAKTLALQRYQKSAAESKLPSSPVTAQNPDFSYLQLRSRRLEKLPPLIPAKPKRQPQQQKGNRGECPNPNPETNPNPKVSYGISSGSVGCGKRSEENSLINKVKGETDELQASFGENNLNLGTGDRSTRESTPCGIIRDIDASGTPASTTRQTSSAAINRSIVDAMQRSIPTAQEIEEFFSSFAEQQQQRRFVEKYNFDIDNDVPLPGRYDWVQISP